MIDLAPGDELELIAETARRLAESELAPMFRESEAARGVPGRLRTAWQEVGLAGLELPEAAGGAGLGCLARVLVNEELAAADVGAALDLDPYGPALTAALEVGGEDAAQALAQATRHGASRALLIAETDARIRIEGNAIDLDVPWVPADEASALIILMRDEVLLVTAAFELGPTRGAGLRAAGSARLSARQAPIAFRWSNPAGARRAWARARLYYSSLLLGILRAACSFSTAYAQEREAFGRPIAHHQALAYQITDMHMALEAARLVVHEAAWRVDKGWACAIEAASAWAECIEISRTIGPTAVQILGGHGFMADYPVEKHMREARALGLLLGGFDAAIEEAGRGLIESACPLALAAPVANEGAS